ncbi:HtaA domain-containing protein [Microbacterium sp. zg-Y818]|uniref:HtaA domain-containing protein n=1 Tax=unclassified Microbacterium TaxID=2609290 RepID=UPI00214BFAB2|nr:MULTISPECIES: HtaA domain-containing protein [unclassified Microbacterium]MCR2799344.1 HtaA domain-containing protein [Microbacterium sp. zg.Y818]WIM21344.1 HtaA domain-containing protein [Microbacterium sp. zg-Y818]
MASLEWPIRRSLIAYVGDLDDGEVLLAGGARDSPAGYVFPSACEPDGDVLRFAGSVTVTGYEGALTLPIVDPWIDSEESGFRLTIQDPAAPDSRIRLVTIARLEPQPDGTILGRGVALASPGSLLLTFGPYVAGTPFDDLRITT